jgi:hypothetical protein
MCDDYEESPPDSPGALSDGDLGTESFEISIVSPSDPVPLVSFSEDDISSFFSSVAALF